MLDDDTYDLHIIQRVLDSLSMDMDMDLVVSYYTSFRDLPSPYQADIYIIDIEMPDINGVDAAKILLENNPKAKIIFCSNHDDFVFNSFVVDVFYFARKMHLKEDLTSALKKYQKRIAHSSFSIQQGKDTIVNSYHDILYISTYGNSCIINCLNEKEYEEKKSMHKIYESLPSNIFFPISSSYVINLEYFERLKDDKVILEGCKWNLPITKRNIRSLMKAYQHYLLYALD